MNELKCKGCGVKLVPKVNWDVNNRLKVEKRWLCRICRKDLKKNSSSFGSRVTLKRELVMALRLEQHLRREVEALKKNREEWIVKWQQSQLELAELKAELLEIINKKELEQND